jgi:chaperone modulatory protein CbpM
MSAHVVEVAWLDARETVTLAELSRVCGMTEAELRELMEYGALVPIDRQQPELVFSSERVGGLRRAARLRRDFELDLFAVALLLDYLDRIDALERQIKSLEAHLPGHAQKPRREGPQPWHEPHGSSPA